MNAEVRILRGEGSIIIHAVDKGEAQEIALWLSNRLNYTIVASCGSWTARFWQSTLCGHVAYDEACPACLEAIAKGGT